MTIRFDEALEQARNFVRQHRAELLGQLVVVRDVRGVFRLGLRDSPLQKDGNEKKLRKLVEEFDAKLRPWGPGKNRTFLMADELFAPDAVFESPDAVPLADDIPDAALLERQIIGADWLRRPLPNAAPSVPRVSLFGIRGGVGRTTALTLWARHLAVNGKRVLVVDLDLEAPGVTSTLLPPGARPRFGVVDWFVEDAVGQADDELLREMVESSPLASGTAGEIRVAPAAGVLGASYLAKLSRVYAEGVGANDGFAGRLARLIDALEVREKPDIVLLDSRAGVHDIAAVAIARLDATVLLFAIDTPQTWDAYRVLFETWQQHPTIGRTIAERLRIVAAQVPETGVTQYLERFRSQAYSMFLDHLYVEAAEDQTDAFNFDEGDLEAPHMPISIYWGREFMAYDPSRPGEQATAEQVQARYGEFLSRATELILGELV